MSLVRDLRVPAAVNDIVIETASARYQDVLDPFVRGDEVARDVCARRGKTDSWVDHRYSSYLGEHSRHYALERRWSKTTFWSRRQA